MKKKMLCLAGIAALFSVLVTVQMSAAPTSTANLEDLGVISDLARSEELQMSVGLDLGSLTTSASGCLQCRSNWLSCGAGCNGNAFCEVLCEAAYINCLQVNGCFCCL